MKELQVYDNGGKTLDRYTVLLPNDRGGHAVIALSEGGLAVNCLAGEFPAAKRYDGLGKKVRFDDLSPETRSAILLWMLDVDEEQGTVTLWGVNLCEIDNGRYFIRRDGEMRYLSPLGAWYGVTVTYHREPTKAEIAAGEGGTHYIDVPLWRAIKCRRKLLDRIQVDGVRYRR